MGTRVEQTGEFVPGASRAGHRHLEDLADSLHRLSSAAEDLQVIVSRRNRTLLLQREFRISLRGWHVTGQDRPHHRCDAPRALPVQARPANLYSQEEREEKTAGAAVLVGQACRRSDPPDPGGVLRAAVLRPIPWFPR